MSTYPRGTLDSIMARAKDFTRTLAWDMESKDLVEEEPSRLGVSVHFRVRPVSDIEQRAGYFQTVFCTQTRSLVYAPYFPALMGPCIDVHQYRFTGNHGPETEDSGFLDAQDWMDWDTLESIPQTVTCFAYGQTGSGKTYTMRSLAHRVVSTLPMTASNTSVSILQVLGKSVSDLLDSTHRPVRIGLTEEGLPTVVGATLVQTPSRDQLWSLIETGFQTRLTAPTAKNKTSSRSHLIIQIHVNLSVINLIDLAGSGRHGDSQFHSKERLNESIQINESLMCLKDCIRALSNGASRIPYRNSKLTILLKEAFCPVSRPSRIVMVATVSPTVVDIEHSLTTFRYAASLNPAQLKEDAPIKSTPLLWTDAKLSNWFNKASNGRLRLESLVPFAPAVPGEPPIRRCRAAFEMGPRDWVRRFPHLDQQFVIEVHDRYKAICVRPKATFKALGVTSDAFVETIGVREPRPQKGTMMSRHDIAMAKIKAKGQLKKVHSSSIDTRF